MTHYNLSQNDLERLQDQMQRGLFTADQANVEKVKMQRVLVVTKLFVDVRKSLNQAVKNGELCRMKKDGYKPEVYYHPSFEHLAKGARADHEREYINTLLSSKSATLVHHKEVKPWI